MVAVHSSSQASRGCSGTWLWTNRVHTLGIEARGQQVHRRLQGAGPQHVGLDVQGQGVQVDDAVEGVVVVLVGHPLAQRPQVVAQVEVAGGLDAREHPDHGGPW